MILEGLLVDLVPINQEFLDKMVEFWNNESRWWSTTGDCRPLTRAQVKRMLDAQMEGPEPGYSEVHTMIRAKDGQIIGWMSLWIVQPHRFVWVAAWIGNPMYWSGGHGSDALLLIVDYAFRWLDVRRFVLSTMGLNVRAQRNAEKCGFVFEGRKREAAFVDGRWVDMVNYGLLCDEWPGRAALVEQLGLHQKAKERYAARAAG